MERSGGRQSTERAFPPFPGEGQGKEDVWVRFLSPGESDHLKSVCLFSAFSGLIQLPQIATLSEGESISQLLVSQHLTPSTRGNLSGWERDCVSSPHSTRMERVVKMLTGMFHA